MLKKTITYEDYNGNTRTEDFFFNLTKAELVELEVGEKEGLTETIKKIVAANDNALIIDNFKKIILSAYGKKSEDGRLFKKSDDISNEFAQTEAYSQLFMELATDADMGSAFIRGIIPASLLAEVNSNAAAVASEAPVVTEPIQPVSKEKPLSEYSREELVQALNRKNTLTN